MNYFVLASTYKHQYPTKTPLLSTSSLSSYLVAFILFYATTMIQLYCANEISIKPADFDRHIMPCYGGSNQQSSTSGSQPINSLTSGPGFSYGTSPSYPNGRNDVLGSSSQPATSQYQSLPFFGNDQQTNRFNGISTSVNTFANSLGQQVPRANTIDNFIALVSKIEAANPRLANDVDQLIKTLLSRFRLDNYYYDIRSRAPVDDTDLRTNSIITAIFNMGQESFLSPPFPEHLLSHDEKCSMYFMLSHFIDKSTPLNPSLASIPIRQLSGPQAGQRPPATQAAGSSYPALSADYAYTSGASGNRYPGPSPGYGSPVTGNMNSYEQGINNQPDYMGKNAYGQNVPLPNSQLNLNNNNLRQTGQYAGTLSSNTRYSSPYVDGQARSRDEKVAIEYGVVSVSEQDDAAIVLNRVLLGMLASMMPKQTIRQLATSVFTTPDLAYSPSMIEREVDPLFAVTLADLWATSARTKPGKLFDIKMMGDGGHWNSTMCPTTFRLERSSSIRFTTAELLGGIDGFSLGTLRRRLSSMRKNMRLSEMLRMYYSKNGFRPQIPDIGICNRDVQLNSQLDELQVHAENYFRLYELNVPMTDSVVKTSIEKFDSFKDVARRTATQLIPQDICSESVPNDPAGGQQGEQCEIARANIVAVLDISPQANQAFMNIAVTKLARKLGLSRDGNSLSVVTNQQDSTDYGFNTILNNSTNTAEVGCALTFDTSQSYQGGQVRDPTQLIEMFERAFINLDNEYLVRRTYEPTAGYGASSSGSSGSSRTQSSALGSSYSMQVPSSTQNTGGAKVIIFFNYGSTIKPSRLASSSTNWQAGSSNSYTEQNAYKFQEAKRYLRENFRGAAVLAMSSSREDVVDLVFNSDQDIFTDIPPGSGAPSSSSSAGYDHLYSSSNDPSTLSMLNGLSDQLVQRLMQRMCTVPATFQYPLCFRYPSDLSSFSKAVGYITPGRKQYWMMSPKTFFASKSVRLAFKVEGGRLRVCFGRMPNPDETAPRNGQQYQTNSISFSSTTTSGNPNGNVPQQQQIQPTSSDYYTGMKNGVCKDVSPGQEIDFVISDPCYKTSIAECDPFYFVIKEISNPGENDPNYMCRDPGCKRFDQVKFILTHSGVSCSSAMKTVVVNWYLIAITITLASFGSRVGFICKQMGQSSISSFKQLTRKTSTSVLSIFVTFTTLCNLEIAQAQQGGVYDFGQNRYGEKRDNFTPSEVAAIILLVMTIMVGLALTIGLCYYVTKQSKRNGMTRVGY